MFQNPYTWRKTNICLGKKLFKFQAHLHVLKYCKKYNCYISYGFITLRLDLHNGNKQSWNFLGVSLKKYWHVKYLVKFCHIQADSRFDT